MPKDVAVTDVASRVATVIWSTPYFGNSLITKYEINYKTTEISWESKSVKAHNVAANENIIRIRNLMAATAYDVRIRCQNALGWSEFSSQIQFTTAEEGR